MKCPSCSASRMRVTDSRPINGEMIRRRRCCLACGFRCSTYEVFGDTLDTDAAITKKLSIVREAVSKLIKDMEDVVAAVDAPALPARATTKVPPEWVR